MVLRPSPGRIRTVMQAAGKARSRPRPASAVTPSRCYSTGASRRGFLSASASTRSVRSSSALTALVRRILSQTTCAVRLSLAKQPHRFTLNPHGLLSVLNTARVASYRVRSPLLKGAIASFRSTAQRSSSSGYSQLGRSTLSFARGTLSGLGCRPAAGQLAMSPLRGGVGLQTSRKFSSGGARVFDNLIVNAPLALRLAGDEVEDKAKLARRKVVSSRRVPAAVASARRTGSTFSSAKLPLSALSFATAKQRTAAPTSVSIQSTQSTQSTDEADYDLYFQFPHLPVAHPSTVVAMRLIDPLYDALGGRPPSSPDGARLFDQAFLADAATALEYEHVRYLRAKAILRVLWSAGLEEMELGEEQWTVRIGMRPEEVRELVRREAMFDFDAWCSFELVDDGGGGSGSGSVEWQSGADPASVEGTSTPSLDSFSSTNPDVLSLPDDSALGSASSLYDSRTF